jgi:hypothetical protein
MSNLEIEILHTFQALFSKGFCLFLQKRQNPFIARLSEYTLIRVMKERYVELCPPTESAFMQHFQGHGSSRVGIASQKATTYIER